LLTKVAGQYFAFRLDFGSFSLLIADPMPVSAWIAPIKISKKIIQPLLRGTE